MDLRWGSEAPGATDDVAEFALHALAAVGPGGPLASSSVGAQAQASQRNSDVWDRLPGFRMGTKGVA
jgi:hypothetical protein